MKIGVNRIEIDALAIGLSDEQKRRIGPQPGEDPECLRFIVQEIPCTCGTGHTVFRSARVEFKSADLIATRPPPSGTEVLTCDEFILRLERWITAEQFRAAEARGGVC